jgi:kinetochore protein Mis13/DSN1
MKLQTRRRSPRNSVESVTTEPPPLEVKKKRQKADGAKATNGRGEKETEERTQRDVHTPHQQQDRSKDVTKIALPFADTPIIRRNKEMRKGSGESGRRSSLGMRGRRASSLIDSGKSNGLNFLRNLFGTKD